MSYFTYKARQDNRKSLARYFKKASIIKGLRQVCGKHLKRNFTDSDKLPKTSLRYFPFKIIHFLVKTHSKFYKNYIICKITYLQ